MKYFCVATPAILDKECIEITTESLVKNLFTVNPDTQFVHLVQACDHSRSGTSGTLEEIKTIYEKAGILNNVEVLVETSSPRLGHTQAGYHLFRRFAETKIPHMIIIEDDTQLMHPIDLLSIEELLDDKSIIHFSMGYDYPGMNKWKIGDRGKEDCSSEAFLEEQIKSIGDLHVFSNYRNFCSWNGTFFSQNMVSKILNLLQSVSRDNCEDQIGKMPFYTELPVHTLGMGKDVSLMGRRDDYHIHFDWQLPKEHHILLEILRRGRAGGRLGHLA